jgi:hypothetical protein
MSDEQELYANARKRVEELKGFYSHALIYIVVNLGLMGLNLLTSPGYYWFVWPMLGWGIGLVAHGFSVFGAGRLFGPEWEQRKIRELVEKERRNQGPPAA